MASATARADSGDNPKAVSNVSAVRLRAGAGAKSGILETGLGRMWSKADVRVAGILVLLVLSAAAKTFSGRNQRLLNPGLSTGPSPSASPFRSASRSLAPRKAATRSRDHHLGLTETSPLKREASNPGLPPPIRLPELAWVSRDQRRRRLQVVADHPGVQQQHDSSRRNGAGTGLARTFQTPRRSARPS
jgi:hypothetical protein